MAKAKAVAAAVVAFAVGNMVTFKGYSEEVPEAEQMLTEGAEYEVVDVNEAEGSLGVVIDNPDFNPKKKESDANQKTLVVDVFFEEVELAEEAAADDEAAEAAPPARTARTAGKAKAADPVEEKPVAKAKGKVVPVTKAAPAAKGKAATKGKAVAKPAKKEAPAEVDESEALPELAEEDAEILELIDGADLVELASDMVNDSEVLNYRLGGILYHLRLGKSYQELSKDYVGKGGWQKCIENEIPGLGYRKAMNLIDIYYEVNLHGIDPAKVQQIGWAKMAKIVQVMDDKNAEELVELAETSTVATLTDAIKESYQQVAAGTKGETRKKTAYKFRLWEDQAVGVTQVLNAVQESMGFKHIDEAFEHIVMEWAAEHPIEPKKATATAKAAPAAKAAAAPAKVAPKARARA